MKKGQTLIIMLVLTGFAMVLMSAALVLSFASTSAVSGTTSSVSTIYAAEGGLESGLISLLRNPTYSGESFVVDNTTVTVTVFGSNPYTLTSRADNGLSTWQVSATAQFASGVMSVTNWSDAN